MEVDARRPSPIDLRLERSLGHFVKLFKDGTELSVKTLGPVHGEWGSFLPAEIRRPSILLSEKASSAPSTETRCQIVAKKDSILSTKRGNVVKPNRENVQDCTNPQPGLKRNSENPSICDNRMKCARKKEDKAVGLSPKKRNLGVCSFSRLHKILPGVFPTPGAACVNSTTLDHNEKRANITPNTPIDGQEKRAHSVSTDGNPAFQEVQGQLTQAMDIYKEAQDLEHRAFRLKNGGQDGLGADIYLESAIKYLHAAHVLEPANCNKIKSGDADQSTRLYIHAGKLFEYVAHIFHQQMQFVPAGLAYKGMEVALMKAGFYKNMDLPKDNSRFQVPCQNQPRAILTPFSNIPPSLPRFLDYVAIMNSAFEGTNGYEKVLRDAGARDISVLKEVQNLDFHCMELVLLTIRRALASSSCA